VPTAPTSPQDTTGRAAEQARKAQQKQLDARREEISVAAADERESLARDVFDPKTPDAPLVLDEIETVGVQVKQTDVIIRTITDIEDMTFGVGNNYSFKAGVKYKVPVELAAHLERLGYIWSHS
jgi:hypothetical protein